MSDSDKMIMRTVITLFIFLALLSGSAFAMSISPPRIFLDDVLKGSSTEKSVLLGGIEEGSAVSITLDGHGSEWINVTLGTEFYFPGESEIFLPFVLDVPGNAPNGDYKVNAQIISSPKKSIAENNGASISSGLFAEIIFSVTGDEVKSYRVSGVTVPKFEQKSPLSVVIEIDNSGNVIAKPSEVEIEIRDGDEGLVFKDSETNVPGVDAFSVGESVVTFSADLGPDVYFADVKVHTHDKIVEVSDISFDVLLPRAFRSSARLESLIVQDDIAKITGILENTGEISFYASLVGEVYKDGNLIGTFRSEESYAEKRSNTSLVFFYATEGEGDYTIKSHAEFLGERTNEKQVSFSIPPAPPLQQERGSNYIMIIFPVSLAIIAFLVWLKRRRNVCRFSVN